MNYHEHVAAVRREGEALGAAGRRGLSPAVPCCPPWTVARLVGHTGRVHRNATRIVGERLRSAPARRPPRPPEGDAVVDWYDEGLAALLDVLAGTDPAEPVWNWSVQPATAAFWARRMAQETAVHRVDGESAHGDADPVDPVLAADGITEVFEVFVPRVLAQGSVPGLDGTLHLHATDLPGGADVSTGEWQVRFAPDSVAMSREHARADAALRGPACELLLVLWGRRPRGAVGVYGDEALLDRWVETMRF